MEQLEYFGIPGYIIRIWKKHYSDTLLPVQEKAVRQFNILQDNHARASYAQYQGIAGALLVISPSSSGKTLVGEMAAIQEISLRKKVIFLVPLRILAEEKYKTIAMMTRILLTAIFILQLLFMKNFITCNCNIRNFWRMFPYLLRTKSS